MRFSNKRRSHLASAYEGAFSKQLPRRITEKPILRPSGFPTCSVLTYMRLEQLARHGFYVENDNLFSEFFTGVGTTVHSVIQKWIGMSGRMYGEWECHKCAVKRKMVGHLCPKCRSPMEYHEIEVSHGIITGHVDGILQLPDKRYWTIDYKTATVRKIDQAHLYLPVKNNVFQILAYSYILKHEYKLDVAGASLLYLARNNPHHYHESQFPFDAENERRARNIIKGETYKYTQAVQAHAKRDVDIALAAKPCKNKEHYRDFFGEYHQCPFVDVCFGRTRDFKAAIKTAVENP